MRLPPPVRAEWMLLRELTRLFFGRFLENDLISLDGDTRATLVNLLAVLASPGVIFPLLVMNKYGGMATEPMWMRDWQAVPEKMFYLSFSMTVLGIVTVLEWDAMFPDQRDYTVLRPLPIRLGTIFTAKVAALGGFWWVFTVAVNSISCVVFPIVVMQRGGMSTLIWFIRCHAAAILLANAFVFLALVGTQGLLMNLLGWRRFRRVAPYAQLVLIAALLAMFFASSEVASGLRPRSTPAPALLAYPPLWFLGFYQRELGWAQPLFQELAGRAHLAVILAAGAAALAYAFSYRRYVRASLEAMDAPGGKPGRISLALEAVTDRRLLTSPAERAAFHFTRSTLLRSRRHKVLLAAWAGAGVALVFQGLASFVAGGSRGWWQNPRGPLLPVPLILSFLVLFGIRYIFTIPAELRANWLFRASPRGEPRRYVSGVRKAIAVTAIVPLFSILLVPYAVLWGWRLAALHILFGCVVSVLLADVLLAGFEKLPFTCSYVPGKANIKVYWPLYAGGFIVLVGLLSGFEIWILARPIRALWLLALIVAVKGLLALYRYRVMLDNFEFIFDDRPEPAVRTLDLLPP